jgi:hypothetical protein
MARHTKIIFSLFLDGKSHLFVVSISEELLMRHMGELKSSEQQGASDTGTDNSHNRQTTIKN